MLDIKLDATSLDASAAERVIKYVKNYFPDKTGSINVQIISADELKQLNHKYAGKNEATDVLAFNYQETDPSKVEKTEIGDVAISHDHVVKQAKVAGTDEATELALLTLHGSLHLLGYDHARSTDLVKMDDIQKAIMAKAGLTYRNFGWQN